MRDVPALLEKATTCLRSARLLLESGDHASAVNRAFYAMQHVATAALAREGAEPKSHSGLISEFSQRFVRTGRVPANLGRAFNEAENERLVADYTDRVSTPERARYVVEQAEHFVAAVRAVLAAGSP